MQISDLLGKYGQNTVPVTAQEQAVKTGTQQLTGTLSPFKYGLMAICVWVLDFTSKNIA